MKQNIGFQIFKLFLKPMPLIEITVWHVLIASGLTALCTGLGIIPFLFVDRISNRFLGFGNSLAAGLMMGASIGLVFEAHLISDIKLAIGLALSLIHI